MNKSFLVRLVITFLTTAALSGCLMIPVEEGNHRGGFQDRNRGDHHEERHEGAGERR